MNRRSAGCPRVPALIVLVFAAGLPLSAVPAAAATALYKWTDASGRIVYSDQPPPGDTKSEVLRAAPAPANPNAVRDLATKDAELRQRQAQRGEQEKKSDKTRADAARKEDACAQIRGQIKAYQSDTPIYRLNEKGDRVYVDDAARQRERERLQALQREQCPA